MKYIIYLLLSLALVSCSSDDDSGNNPISPQTGFFSEYNQRNFSMGFTTWPYGPDADDVENTFTFLANNGDIYGEHIDNNIPWTSWINNTALPSSFVDEIGFKKSKTISSLDLLLSVSVLNPDRHDLANDFSGNTPSYTSMNDSAIINAYYKHVSYLIDELSPKYLVISIEGNELLINTPDKWEAYKLLISEVRQRVKNDHPDLMISESVTLHNLYEPTVSDPEAYIEEVLNHVEQMDFMAVSFYPFFKALNTKEGFQEALDFLHSRVSKPIAFSETAHIAEDLVVPNINLNIPGDPDEQDEYLQTLLTNAQQEDYLFVIWWAQRDYDELWETFPASVKDLGQLWRDTGLLDEDGNERQAYSSWRKAFITPNP